MVPHALCPSAYECYRCEVDQRAEDTLGTHPAFVAHPAKQTEPVSVSGYAVMPDRYYHSGHVWAEKIGDGYLRLGLDDFARRLVGPVDEIELLIEGGAEVTKGEKLWQLKLANKKSVTMHSPVSGTILSINADILLDPTLLQKDPYTRGWICIVRPADTEQELTPLRFKNPSVPLYLRQAPDPVNLWVNDEADKLRQMLVERGADIPADAPIRVNLPEVLLEPEWRIITQAFFGGKE